MLRELREKYGGAVSVAFDVKCVNAEWRRDGGTEVSSVYVFVTWLAACRMQGCLLCRTLCVAHGRRVSICVRQLYTFVQMASKK